MKKQAMTTSEKVFNLCVESAKNSKNGYTFDCKEVWQAARKKYKLSKEAVKNALNELASDKKVNKIDDAAAVVELMPKPSPIMKQYNDFKEKHPDAILLFRRGDFYEAYADDAKVCAQVLGITLTVNPKDGMKMAGFPHHALDTYLPKLIRAGKRVAICDELESPKVFKKSEPGYVEEVKDTKQKKAVKHELTPCEIINLDAQKKARELYPDQFKRFVFFRLDTTSGKEYKNVDAAIRAKADMNNLAYGIEVVEGVRYTGTSRINAYENFLAATKA